MKKAAMVFLAAAMASPALAARPVTVDELAQVVAGLRGKPDAKAAQQIYELELTERLSGARLAREQAEAPGEAARHALTVVADASVFLDLPAADLPAAPAPDRDTQARMWAAAVNYASRMIPRLPNFFATRDTERFQDTPAPHAGGGAAQFEPMHLTGSASETVLYRDRKEFVKPAGKQQKDFDPSDFELSSEGEFGPILENVLADSALGGVTWSHWEQGPAGLKAVYRYAVAGEASHYTVNFPSPTRDRQLRPAYHGEIAINPEDGSILRLTMVADLKPEDPGTGAGLMVEYGAVEIGGSIYICPIRSVVLSKVWMVKVDANSMTGEQLSRGGLQTRVNDVAFTQYHLFRGEVRIVPGAAAESDGK